MELFISQINSLKTQQHNGEKTIQEGSVTISNHQVTEHQRHPASIADAAGLLHASSVPKTQNHSCSWNVDASSISQKLIPFSLEFSSSICSLLNQSLINKSERRRFGSIKVECILQTVIFLSTSFGTEVSQSDGFIFLNVFN